MLNNRILVIGLDKRTLELLGQIRSDFLFIALEHPGKYSPSVHAFEAVVFSATVVAEMETVLADYRGRPAFGLGRGPRTDGVTWLPGIDKLHEFEKLLLDTLGTLRAPPRKTGELDPGTVVKNKTFASWGPGVVKRALDNDLFLVNFPGALKIVKKEDHVCHKSILRIICSIKELSHEAS